MQIRDIMHNIDHFNFIDIYSHSKKEYLAKDLAVHQLDRFADLEICFISADECLKLLITTEE